MPKFFDRYVASRAQSFLESDKGKELIKSHIERTQMPSAPKREQKAQTWSPFGFLSDMGRYKERVSPLTYGTLRRMSYQTPVVSAIINTRTTQVSSFSVPQRDRFSLGFTVRLREVKRHPKTFESREMLRIERFMQQTGVDENKDKREDFDTFLRKIIRDTLTFDQMNFEVVPDRRGVPAEFYSVDAATIRLAGPLRDNRGRELGDLDPNVDYVQVIDNAIVAEFSRGELVFSVRNPRSDIYANGYGFGELEMLINVVTAMLFSDEYNKAFFSKGSAPKGMILIRGQVNDANLEAFKRQWLVQVQGVENCLAGESTIWIPTGAVEVGKFLGDAETRGTLIWTGECWRDGLVYKAGLKVPVRTTLGNGVSLTTSPDHRFRVLGAEGFPEWKRQGDLQIGDFVLVSKKPVESDCPLPVYQGKEITPELMEVLGWMTGDGYISFEGSGHQKNNRVQWFYRDSEEWIRDRHLEVLKNFDAAAEAKDHTITEEEKECIRERYGFKDIADRRLTIQLFSVRFTKWLDVLGFRSSKMGKVIPSFVHVMPDKFKSAFLRGLFSADGNNAKRRSPTCTIANDTLREQTKLLLLSLGIRTSLSEGRTKIVIDGRERGRVEAKSVLRVKDRDAFFEVIGFLQPHKQPTMPARKNETNKCSRVSHATVLHFMRLVRAANGASGKILLSYQERLDLNSILCGTDGCSLPRLLRFVTAAGIKIPSWLTDYHFEPVVSLEVLNGGVPIQMYDVEIHDDFHAFTANGIINHNSWKTPIIQTENEGDVQWVDLQRTNREMEFRAYSDYLTRVACAVYLIDPSEINFYGQGGGGGQVTFESKEEQRIKYSRDKGLKPLLQHTQNQLNRSIIWKLNEDFELAFEGLNIMGREETATLVQSQVQYYRTVNEVRAEMDLSPLPPPVGDMILNQIVVMAKQQAEMAKNPQAAQGLPGVPGMQAQPGESAGQQAQPASNGNAPNLFDMKPEEIQQLAKSIVIGAEHLRSYEYEV